MLAALEKKQSKPSRAGVSRPDASARDGKASPESNSIWQSLALRPRAIQPKLAISQPDDPDEREADRVAERVMRMATPTANHDKLSFTSDTSLKAQRKCTGCEEEEEKKLQRKERGSNPDSPATAPAIVHESLRSSGQPVDPTTREFMESRFGYDFSHVRVHTDARAAESARTINAHAFTLGSEIVFGAGKFTPQTESGRRLLAHELSHVVQQAAAQGGPVSLIQRQHNSLWDEVKVTRELEPGKIPKSFNYELVHHRLIAHTVSTSDIDSIVNLVSILSLSFKLVVDEGDLKKRLTELRKDAKEGEMRDLDVTPFLPESLQRYLAEMEKYYEAYRKYVEKMGFTPDTIWAKYDKLLDKAQSKEERAKLYDKGIAEVTEWNAGMPHMPDEYHAACHQLMTLETGGTATGAEPGKYVGKSYAEPLKMKLDEIVGSLQSSLKGKGPYRPVDAKDVQVGDIAVFLAGKTIKGEGNEPIIAKGGAIHSAIVIRVSGKEIELLEKTNPHAPMATRTVKEVLDHYASDNAYVNFLSPTLKGMPATSPGDIGNSPPSKKFTTVRAKSPEDTHLLFKANTNVTLPHEDRKLFGLIARINAPAEVNVHGYASVEGDEPYNLNLSAHRAVAVGDALETQLPANSKIELFAHGETEEFGSKEEARRAGIELKSTKGGGSKQN